MVRKWMAAGALTLGMLVASATGSAWAGTNIDIGIGLGGGRISCGQGVRIVRSAGFHNVRPINCHGINYLYRGIRRDRLYQISVRSRSGQIRDVVRLGGWGGGGGYGGGDYDDYDDYDDGDY